MESFHPYIRIVHISFGAIALFAGPAAMLLKKGSPRHKLFGKIYFYAMAVVAVTAIIMSTYHHIPFLLMIAVFSFSGAVTGYRAIYQKQVRNASDVKTLDWVVEAIKIAFGVALIVYAVIVFQEDNLFLAILAVVFGIISARSGISQIQRNRKTQVTSMRWFFEHMGNMAGSYIATVTAFLVNTVHDVPPLLLWLSPTAIGLPLIFYWIRVYRKRIEVKHAVRFEEVV